MKEIILSTCEKSFVLRAITEGKRLDGRQMNECRKLQICFGTDWGCCQVSLGETKVLAQVTCEVQQPKATRPNEGLLFLNVELSPMGAPHFEIGRQSELAVQLNRLLEKCVKDSRCVDLESLCIVAEEKVWALRVDVNILNHEGNLIDAASAAALTALSHFRRPDVTITGEQTIIHDPSEKDPIPISLHHHPVCVSFAIFNKGDNVIADPTVIEERVSEAQVVFGVNAYRELCGLHLGGNSLATHEIILHCADRAAKRAGEVIQIIKTALEEDSNARASEKAVGFAECIRDGKILALAHDRLSLRLDTDTLRNRAWTLVSGTRKRRKRKLSGEGGNESEGAEDEVMDEGNEEDEEEVAEDEPSIVPLGKGSAELLPKQTPIKIEGQNQWMKTEDLDQSQRMKVDEDYSDSTSGSSDIEVVKEVSYEDRLKFVESIELSGDSEEEETVTLQPADMNLSKPNNKKEKKKSSKNSDPARNWYPMQQW